MVNSATAFGRNGTFDWLWQRISALVLTAFIFFLTYFFIKHPNLTYTQWHALFSNVAMRIFFMVTLLALVIHAWIGMWTILKDYINCLCLRFTLQISVILSLIAFFFWGFFIVWSL